MKLLLAPFLIVFLFAPLAVVAEPKDVFPALEDMLLSPSAKDILNQIEGIPTQPPSHFYDGVVLLYFSEDVAGLDEMQEDLLLEHISSSFDEDLGKRIKIISYASGENDGAARRRSLERALKVRRFLRHEDISLRFVDIFPMGRQVSQHTQERVEVYLD